MSEIFAGISNIKYEAAKSTNPLAFKFYDAEKVVMGKPMKDWLRFAMAWWHTLCGASGDQFGGQTRSYEWDKSECAVQRAKDKMDAGFEIMQKLGIEYFCFHDVDLIPEAEDINETNRRREKQEAYNKEHNITPKTVYKEQRQLIKLTKVAEESEAADYAEKALKKKSTKELNSMAKELERRMQEAAKALDFELAAELRDRLILVKGKLGQKLVPKKKK